MELKQYILIGLLIYFFIMGIVGFVQMYLDKGYAKKGKWRIREKTLFLTAFFGASFGSVLGMYTFRHKTKHIQFQILMPLFAIIHLAVLIAIIIFL